MRRIFAILSNYTRIGHIFAFDCRGASLYKQLCNLLIRFLFSVFLFPSIYAIEHVCSEEFLSLHSMVQRHLLARQLLAGTVETSITLVCLYPNIISRHRRHAGKVLLDFYRRWRLDRTPAYSPTGLFIINLPVYIRKQFRSNRQQLN